MGLDITYSILLEKLDTLTTETVLVKHVTICETLLISIWAVICCRTVLHSLFTCLQKVKLFTEKLIQIAGSQVEIHHANVPG